MTKIPDKDVNIIRDVAIHVAGRNFVKGYDQEDLVQELFIYGMESYSKWDETKHAHKVEGKRDNNLRLFLKGYMVNRVNNMKRDADTLKKGKNVTVISVDYREEGRMDLEDKNNPLDKFELDGLNLTEDQKKILMYIAANGLGKGGATKEVIGKDLNMDKNKITKILTNLRKNTELKEFLMTSMT